MAILFFAVAAFAQRYSFRHYTQTEGLTNLGVNCLLRDRDGFVWVGTQSGLFRYDGNTFRNFSEGLPSADVQALHQPPGGPLWIGTRTGLARWTGSRVEPAALPWRVELIGASTLDSDSAGTLYVAAQGGLARIPARRTGRPGDIFIEWLWRGTANSVHASPSGPVWYGCDEQLCVIEGDRARVVPGLPDQQWESIATDATGRLWVRSSSRLFVRGDDGKFSPRDAGLPPSGALPGPLLAAPGQPLMVPTDGGLAIQSGGGWELVGAKKGLPGDSVAAVVRDNENSLWIAVRGAGIARWMGYAEWDSWTAAEGLSNDVLWGIARGTDGGLWVGTNSGLNRMDAQGNWRAWKTAAGLAGDRVRTLAIGPDGDLWAGSSPGGITRFRGTSIVATYKARSGLANPRLHGLLFDRDGRLWVAAVGGLFRSTARAAGQSDEIRFERMEPPGSDSTETFLAPALDAKGRVWIPGSRGLLAWDRGTWSRYTERDGLRHAGIQGVVAPADGAVWVAYREPLGMSRLDQAKHGFHVRHFDRNSGLRSDKVYFLGLDANGGVWAGLDAGVDVFEDGRWRHFGRVDGLIWDDCDTNSFLAEADGAVWIGTSRGLSRWRRRVSPPVRLPAPILTRLEAGGALLSRGADGIRLKHNAGTLRIEYTVLSFRKEHEIRYRYRLANLDDAWIDSDRHEARYYNVPPGSYRFELKARLEGEDREVAFEGLPVTVAAPWWSSLWFRVLLGSALFYLLWSLWIWRMRRAREDRRLLELAIQERTRELAAEKARAEQANRAKSEFLANVSHELRTPLNGIVGATDLTLSTGLTAEQQEYLQITRHSAESLLGLLNDILDFSKIEAGRMDLSPETFRFREWLGDALKSLRVRAQQKGLDFRVETGDAVPEWIFADAARLRQVLINLAGNAVKFTQTGFVRVRVEVETEDDGRIVLRFSVQDTGIGIPADKHDVIFESFRQVDGSTTRHYGGTGLGLAICRRLVGMMDGRIWMDSVLGRGSSFHFTARLARGTPGAVPEPPAARVLLPALPASLRVLVAEDNHVNQVVATRILEKEGMKVAVAANGNEAIERYRTGQFDLILMDVQMPELDGFGATACIRQIERGTGSRIPIVAMTAHALKGDRERCIDAGMDDYISKPIRADELLAVIRALASGAAEPIAR